MGAYKKTVLRTIKSNIARFIAMTAIIAVGICFVSGLGALSPKILDSYDEYLKSQKISDVIIKSKSEDGFTSGQLERLLKLNDIESKQEMTVIDTDIMSKNARAYIYSIKDSPINNLTLVSGNYPSSASECLVERSYDESREVQIGQSIDFMGLSMKVSGVVANPLYFTKDDEPDMINQKSLELILYIDKAYLPTTLPLPITDVCVKVERAQDYYMFSSNYENTIKKFVSKLETEYGFDDEGFALLSLEENKSFAMLVEITNKVDIICLVFPVFFILVTALVVLTTMTRLIEEERSSIGCYKSLGFSDRKVIQKYLLFSLLCCVLGMTIGVLVGAYFLPTAICPAFDTLFFLPQFTNSANLTFGIISAVSMLAVVLFVTLYVCMRELRDKPSELLRAKSPKAGRKIFLERIPFLWNRLKFKHKSSLRNIFRYTGRLLMIIISVAGSTALVMAGMGLYDVSSGGIEISGVFRNVSDTITMISIVVIIFAAILCVLVLYNLTNMNIGERKREIATLKVLGYHDGEVCGYIFREIFIMSVLGILIGLPIGVGILTFVFSYLDFGMVSSISWYSYLITAGITLLFIAIVDLLLYPKIKAVDMNASLKTVE